MMMTNNGCAGAKALPKSDIVGVTRLVGAHPGPVLLVIAGLHGDEASGPMAAELLAAGPAPARGTIVVLPVAAPEAQGSGQRWAPGWSDLNRAFLFAEGDRLARGKLTDPSYRRADALFNIIADAEPCLVLDLHESDRYWTEGEGPMLIVPASSRSSLFALDLLEASGMERFSFTGPPPEGSLVAAVDALLDVPALIIEAPENLALEERVRLHGLVISAALRMLGMLGASDTP